MHTDSHSCLQAELDRFHRQFPRPGVLPRANVRRSGEVKQIPVVRKSLSDVDIEVDSLQSRLPSRSSYSADVIGMNRTRSPAEIGK